MDTRLTIGAELKEAGNARNMTIDEVANELCISKRYVAALEDDQYTNLPEGPFALGFLRSLAGFYRLDAERLVEALKCRIKPSEKPAKEPVMVKEADNEKGGLFSRLFMTVFSALLCTAYVFSSIDFSPEVKTVETPPVPQELVQASMMPQPRDIGNFVGSIAGETSVFAIQQERPLFEIKSKADAWVLIKDAKGKVLIDTMLKKGEKLETPEFPQIKLTSSNAKALSIYMNGEKTDFKATENFIVAYQLGDYLAQLPR